MQESTSADNRRLGTVALTIASLVAFAGNSVLCRMALLPGEGTSDASIGPGEFTAVRLLAGALALGPLLMLRRRGRGPSESTLPGQGKRLAETARSAPALVLYALAFSYSYVTLPAGIGALVLFGTVQVVMVLTAVRRGDALGGWQWIGLLLALIGLVVLVKPWASAASVAGATPGAPGVDPLGALAMTVAGIGWAAYTLVGRGSRDPIRSTAANFVAAAPAAVAVLAFLQLGGNTLWSPRGLALAALSGAVTSGAGYALWYAALRGHTRTSAAVVQLVVPVLAVAGGAVLLEEPVTRRLVASAALVLGGIAVTLLPRAR